MGKWCLQFFFVVYLRLNYSKQFNDLLANDLLALKFERSLPFGLLVFFLINLCCIVDTLCDLVHDVDVMHDLC